MAEGMATGVRHFNTVPHGQRALSLEGAERPVHVEDVVTLASFAGAASLGAPWCG